MINQEILFFVKEQLRAGSSRDAIRKALVESGGWGIEEVDDVFRFVLPTKEESTVSALPVSRENLQKQTPTSPSNRQVASAPVEISSPIKIDGAILSKKIEPESKPASPYLSGMMPEWNIPREKIATKEQPAPIQTSWSNPPTSPASDQRISESKFTNRGNVEGIQPMRAQPFVGMPESGAVIREQKISKTPKLLKSLLVGVFVAAVILGAFYTYVTYIRPSKERVLGSSLSRIASLETFSFSSKSEMAVTLNQEGMSDLRKMGADLPLDFSETVTIPFSLDTNGSVIFNENKVVSSSASHTIKTTADAPVDIQFSGEGVYTEDKFSFNPKIVSGVSSFEDFFQIQNPTWLFRETSESLSKEESDLLVFALEQFTRLPSRIQQLIDSGVLVVTSPIESGETGVFGYQFSFNKEKLVGLFGDDVLESVLSKLTVTDGEFWLNAKTSLPEKIIFKIRIEDPNTGIDSLFSKTTIAFSGYNEPASLPTISDGETISERVHFISAFRHDTEVKNTLSTARAVAEVYYSSKKSYLGFCTSSLDTAAKTLIEPLQFVVGEGNVVCVDTKKTFVMSAPLFDGGFFCVDSIGSALNRDTSPTISCIGD